MYMRLFPLLVIDFYFHTDTRCKIVTQLFLRLFGLFYLFRLQPHTITLTATPHSFPARPLCGLSLMWPLTQWTPWMDNSALQWGPMTIAKPAAGAHSKVALARGHANSWERSLNCRGDFWTCLGNHRCEGWKVASTPCERIKIWSCLLDAKEKWLLTGAQGLDGGSRAGLYQGEPLESLGLFFIKQRKQGIRAVTIKPTGFMSECQK